MSIRVPLPLRRPQAKPAHGQAQVDAFEPAAERAARPGPKGRPEMNRRERLIFTVYVVLAILIVLFLAATGVLWWLGR
jgi:type VI protein secretion system component VasF